MRPARYFSIIQLSNARVFSSDNRIYLTKEQTQMTKGMAILSMLVLHLFCRKGGDVFGTPIFWLNTDTPFVYILGFLAEICVPLYSLVFDSL